MLSSPYPPLRVWHVASIVSWASGVGAGMWVLTAPPQSYQGLGLALTMAWGGMLIVGSGTALAGTVARRITVELPGAILALGGLAIYIYLSWQQTLTTSPGSGPRTLLLMLLAGLIVGRIAILLHVSREARRLVAREPPA